MSEVADTRWDSVKGSITAETYGDVPHLTFRLSIHSPQHGWQAQAVSVPVDRLEKHDHLYKTTLDTLVRELGVWDPQ